MHAYKIIIHVIVIHPWGLYLICKLDAQGQGVYNSDTNQIGVLQLLCVNSVWADQRRPIYVVGKE